MKIVAIILITIYGLALSVILLYSFVQLSLVIQYLRSKRYKQPQKFLAHYPLVSVQLPLYNEQYVVERLIDAITAFKYPKDRIEIQILDDSDDETVHKVDERVKHYRSKGFDISAIRREDRKGFKAGALANGLKSAKGEFVAIFDADFVPRADFLENNLAWFNDPKIGMVQTRWEHLNKNYSLFTLLQAFGLDAHFSVEQRGRNFGGHFINFNGTGGIWRKQCIEEAGGWHDDTLTEDLDLSYRAQLKGWKFHFVEEYGSPAELPAEMGAIRSQQFRWNKGAAETARKLIPNVLNSTLPLKTKIHAFFHLLGSSVFIFVLLCGLLSVPMIFIKNQNLFPLAFQLASIFLMSLGIVSVLYFISFRQHYQSNFKALSHFAYVYPLFLSYTMGLSLHNAWAVIQGFTGVKSAFIRTPKFNIINKKGSWAGKKYVKSKVHLISFLEGLLCLYFISGVLMAVFYDDYGLLPFHLMLSFGFGSIFIYTLWHHLSVKRASI